MSIHLVYDNGKINTFFKLRILIFKDKSLEVIAKIVRIQSQESAFDCGTRSFIK